MRPRLQRYWPRAIGTMATSCPADMATDPYERAEPKFSGAAMWGAAGGKWSWRIAKKWILPTPLPASNFLNLRPTQLRSEKSLKCAKQRPRRSHGVSQDLPLIERNFDSRTYFG